VCGVSFILPREVIHPLVSLKEAVDHAATGNYEVEFELHGGGDEVMELAKSVQNLISLLRRNHKTRCRRVQAADKKPVPHSSTEVRRGGRLTAHDLKQNDFRNRVLKNTRRCRAAVSVEVSEGCLCLRHSDTRIRPAFESSF